MTDEQRARRYELAEKIVRLVNDVRADLMDRATRGEKMPTFAMLAHADPRNWNATVMNSIPDGGFMELFWADVFRVSPRRVMIGHSELVERFVEENRFTITEWELLGQVGE